MSTAYYIVLNTEDPGFDPFVDGKALTRRLRTVNKIARDLGLGKLEDFAFHDLSEFGGPQMEPEWFDASEGKRWASMMLQHLRKNPRAVRDSDAVADDLESLVSVLDEADKRGLKWHFELDF